MTKWLVILGILGIFGTGVVTVRLSRWTSHQKPQYCWFLGIAALFPAWLIAFIGLLPSSTGQAAEVSLPPSAILSSGVALFGIILTDYTLRRLSRAGQVLPPLAYWALGVAALLPAWCIALVVLSRR